MAEGISGISGSLVASLASLASLAAGLRRMCRVSSLASLVALLVAALVVSLVSLAFLVSRVSLRPTAVGHLPGISGISGISDISGTSGISGVLLRLRLRCPPQQAQWGGCCPIDRVRRTCTACLLSVPLPCALLPNELATGTWSRQRAARVGRAHCCRRSMILSMTARGGSKVEPLRGQTQLLHL